MTGGRYDLAVVGGGTAGLVAAIGAAQLGARVCLAEADRTGGECLWTGCVPSKTLLAAAALAQRMRTADSVGLGPVAPVVNFGRLMAHVRAVQQRLAPHDSAQRLRAEGVDVLEGTARFTSSRQLDVAGRTVTFRTALIATGSQPVLPDILGLAAAQPLTTHTVWDLSDLPARLAVLGGGPVGVELGQAFARLGASVTLLELLPSLLPNEEPEAATLLATRLRADGVRLLLGVRVQRVETCPGQAPRLIVGHSDGSETLEADRVLLATGRRPRTEGLGLEAAGVAIAPSGGVVVDDRLQTTAPHIYAVGDVTATLPFTHVAAYQARTAIGNALFGLRRRVRYDAVPYVTFTDPEIAHVGLTEAQARERWGARTVVRSFDQAHLDRTVCTGEPDGLVKLVADARARLVGATIVGPSAGDVVAETAALVAHHSRIAALSARVHAYPTFAEGPVKAADEHLRAQWLNERTRRITRPVLALLRLLDR